MRRLAIMLVMAACWCAFANLAAAVEPEEQLKDPVLEARAREISAGLRCLVCQNQSIDDSDAPLARDLRLVVRQQLQKGASDREVRDYLVARYGEFVLLNPRFGLKTLILWLTPVLLLGGGIILAGRVMRRQTLPTKANPLTPEEEKALSRLLSGGTKTSTSPKS